MILAIVIALVVENDVTLRAAPRDSSAAQERLVRGEWLEVRGEEAGWLKVYDRRRERPGYVRPAVVRVHSTDDAASLRAIVAFLRDAPGYESLGIAYAAMAMRAAPKESATMLQAAIGTMAERFALKHPVGGQRDVLEDYGVHFVDLEREGHVQVCYEGAAFREVLAAPDAPLGEKQRAALALTDRACLQPELPAPMLRAWNEWRASVLEKAEVDSSRLGQLLRLRRAETYAWLAFQKRSADDSAAALDALGGVDASLLSDDDKVSAADAALRVSASRWASAAPVTPRALQLSAGRPGETCMTVASLKRCTFGLVWTESLRETRDAVAVVVQPTESWTELYVFHKNGKGWRVDILPAGIDGSVGYIEPAGFSPDGKRILVARESLVRGKLRRSFEVRRLRDLRVLESSREPGPAFDRWSAPSWRGMTLALR